MNIDWVVALSLFLVVIAWSFSFYTGFFTEKTEPLSDVLESISDKFVNYLVTDTYIMHANYTAGGSLESWEFYVDIDFPEGTNYSTKVYQDGSLVDGGVCELQTNQVVFSGPVEPNNNSQFVIKFQNISGNRYCAGTLEENKKLKGSAKERRMLVSQAKINTMNVMSVEDIKGNLNINRNFRVEIEVNETIAYVFGLQPPNATAVYVKEAWNKMLDDDNRILIRTMVW